MERVFDILGMVSVLVVMLFFSINCSETNSEDLNRVQNLQRYGGIFGIFALVCMAVFFALTAQRGACQTHFEFIVRPAPQPVQNLFLSLYDGFVKGLSAIQSPKSVILSAVLSIGMWLNGALAIFVLFKAFFVATRLWSSLFYSGCHRIERGLAPGARLHWSLSCGD